MSARTPRPLPDFCIAGHPKCGTTAMYEFLSQHPSVFMSALKEPMFFCTDYRWRFRPAMAGPLPENLTEYRELFDGAADHQLCGEASTFYLSSQTAAENLVTQNQAIRVIAVLRDPVDLLHSLHLQFLQSHIETVRDLRRCLELEDARRAGRKLSRRSFLPQVLQYSSHVRYAEQLRRLYAMVPREQVLLLIYEDFREDNMRTLREITRHLGLSDFLFEPVVANPSVHTRSQRLDAGLNALSVGRGRVATIAKRAIVATTPMLVRRRAHLLVRDRVVFGKPPELDETLRRELRERFKPEVVAVSEVVGRDLVARWSYDDA